MIEPIEVPGRFVDGPHSRGSPFDRRCFVQRVFATVDSQQPARRDLTVKLQIPEQSECAKAFSALIRRGRVECLRENVFIVPAPSLEVLKDLGVTYQELGRGGLDFAQKALRDSAATEA